MVVDTELVVKPPHLQTIFVSKAFRSKPVPIIRERIELKDGDFIDINYLQSLNENPHWDIVAIFHGLAGCSESSSLQGTCFWLRYTTRQYLYLLCDRYLRQDDGERL